VGVIHVAVVSANAFDKGQDNEVAIGPEDFILKPVRHSELLDWLERRLVLDWLDAAEPPAAADPAPSAAPGLAAAWTPAADAALLEPLRQAASLGYYRGILNQLDQIGAADSASGPWVASMRALAQQFRFEDIVRALPASGVGATP
jgi:hypothetical protein